VTSGGHGDLRHASGKECIKISFVSVRMDEINSISLDNLLNLAHRLPIEPAPARKAPNR
jgi:hypothetical protein